MNKSKHKMRQAKSGKYAVLKQLFSLKLKNYLTPQNHRYEQRGVDATQNRSGMREWRSWRSMGGQTCSIEGLQTANVGTRAAKIAK